METRLAGYINAPPHFPRCVIDYISDFAAQQREALGRRTAAERAHFAALAAVTDLLGRLTAADPRVVALADISGELRQIRRARGDEIDGEEFVATADQRRCIARVGDLLHPAGPTVAEDFLLELIAVGIRDLRETRSTSANGARRRSNAIERELDASRVEVEGLRAALGEAADQADRLAEARAEIVELGKQLEVMREFDAEPESEAPAPPPLDVEAVFDAVEKGLGRLLSDAEVDAIGEAVAKADGSESAEDLAAQLVERFTAPPAPAKRPGRSRRRGKASTSEKEVV